MKTNFLLCRSWIGKSILCMLSIMLCETAQCQLTPLPLRPLTADKSKNYVVKYTPTMAITSIWSRDALSQGRATVCYLDGLGRSVQVVEASATPLEKDLVTPVEPDFYDRETKVYLPYPGAAGKGGYHPDAVSGQASYYNSRFGTGLYPVANAVSGRTYESSSLNRVYRESRPGPLTLLNGTRVKRYVYGTNASSEVRLYQYTGSGVTSTGYYAAGTLYRCEETDEDGRRQVLFKDYGGKPVLERRYISETETADTYYVYDGLDRLVCVLPPAIGGSNPVTAVSFSRYAYRYSYDAAGNIVSRTLPGLTSENIVYNSARLPTERHQGSKHFYYAYDSFNRIVGEYYRYGDSGSRIALHEVTYDVYPSVTGLDFEARTGFASSFDTRTKGQKTYERLRILTGSISGEMSVAGRYLERKYYYDNKGRLIQISEKNQLGTKSVYSTGYDFAGQVLSEEEKHRVGLSEECIRKDYSYDRMGRLLCMEIYRNGSRKGKVCYEYDELGRLQKRTYGEGVLSESLSYDVSGRLTGQESPVFVLGLRYERPEKGKALYGGGLSELSCRYGSKEENVYSYDYDGLHRLTGTHHYVNGVQSDKYVEKNIRYDKNGNFQHLERLNNGVRVDNLSYSYTGNFLSGLTEDVVVSSGDLYVRGASSVGSYEYDAYGNMISDSRKVLNLEYNIINLLHTVKRGGEVVAGYEYSYDGRKLQVKGKDGRGYVYLGGLVCSLQGSACSFDMCSFNGGFLTGSEVYYRLEDHLGSVRVVVDSRGVVKEENDYYAFGLRQSRSNYARLAQNRYKYNGKEEQVTGGLGFLDYGARMYDMHLGRWFTVDPLSEKYYGISPFVYCGNSPLIYIDPDGRAIDDYFTKSGKYLGSDNTETDYIRIISQEDWDKYKIVTEGKEMISHNNGVKYSEVPSKSDISIEASLRIYDHYNITDLSLRNTEEKLTSKKISFSSSDERIISGGMTFSVRNDKAFIKIKIEQNKTLEVSDHFNEIINMFVHEDQHYKDYKRLGYEEYHFLMKGVREKRAIEAQMDHVTYKKTRYKFRHMVGNYLVWSICGEKVK